MTTLYVHYYTMQLELTIISIDGRIKNTSKAQNANSAKKLKI